MNKKLEFAKEIKVWHCCTRVTLTLIVLIFKNYNIISILPVLWGDKSSYSYVQVGPDIDNLWVHFASFPITFAVRKGHPVQTCVHCVIQACFKRKLTTEGLKGKHKLAVGLSI